MSGSVVNLNSAPRLDSNTEEGRYPSARVIPRMVSYMLKVPRSRSWKEDMSQQPQGEDKHQAPPFLAQVTGILVSIGSIVGIWGIGVVIPEKFFPIILIPMFVAAMIGYYLTISCLSRLFTGSWVKYPEMVKK